MPNQVHSELVNELYWHPICNDASLEQVVYAYMTRDVLLSYT
jgi:hypothetical protein